MTVTTTTPTAVSAALNVAADLIDAHGWCCGVAHDQADHFDVIGALEAATHGGHTHVDLVEPADLTADTPGNAIYRQALQVLRETARRRYFCDDLPRVNDRYIHDTAAAAALLLEAAELACAKQVA